MASIIESALDATTELQRRAVGTESRALSCLALAAAGVGLASGASVVLGHYVSWQNTLVTTRKGQRFTSATEIGGGSLKGDQVQKGWENYSKKYGEQTTVSIDAGEVPQLVDTFYNLITDIYEWGWGQSFHFSPSLRNADTKASEMAHETRVADSLRLQPGMKVLDAGCGVGGPMRCIAAHSLAQVTGLTINEYQVGKCNAHNKKAGLERFCEVVQGNFLEMPFGDAHFDAAYSIEAICHAPTAQAAYKEVFRVLKPGALFVTYEWVKTRFYDPSNPCHVQIIDEINYGNALPGMRSHKEVELAAKEVGFNVVVSRDLAAPPAGIWWERLKMGRIQYKFNQIMIDVLSFLRVCPQGTSEAHKMLVAVADSLVKGGETGVFSPMHMLVLQKPL